MKIVYTLEARQDLHDIFNYIAYTLKVPETAKRILRIIISEINSLDFMPERYPIYKVEPWVSQKVRFFPVKNYLIFYTVNRKQGIISIVRIIYSGRNISDILKNLTRSMHIL